MQYRLGLLATLVVIATACAGDAPPATIDSTLAVSAEAAAKAPAPPPDSAITPPSVVTWALTAQGIGPLRAGMTVAQAAKALGGSLPGADTTIGCREVPIPGAPGRVTAMIVDGKLGRVDTKDANIESDLGVRVGDTQAHVESLYVGRVSSQPHKYLATGRYLVISPRTPGDSAYRLIFETDGAKVLEFRGGLTEVASFVEHCG